MPEVESFTHPLSGKEVLEDVLAQIRKRLATDCNMRGEDGYSGGYSGEVTVKLRLFAVYGKEVEMTVPIRQSMEIEAPPVSSFSAEEGEHVEIAETITIPVEPNLTEVRARTKENNEEPIKIPATEQEPETVRTKRKYIRRAALVAATTEQAF